jgi:hypothetical protein
MPFGFIGILPAILLLERDAFTFVHASSSSPLIDRVIEPSGAFAPSAITLQRAFFHKLSGRSGFLAAA